MRIILFFIHSASEVFIFCMFVFTTIRDQLSPPRIETYSAIWRNTAYTESWIICSVILTYSYLSVKHSSKASSSQTPTESAPTSSTPATSTSDVTGHGTNTKLNVMGPVSLSADKDLLKKVKEKLEAKSRVHPAAFRGWKEVGGYQEGDQLTHTDEIMDLLTRSTFLEEHLPEWLYGDWYHIVAALTLGALICWAFGYFKFYLGPVFFVTLPVALYYRSCIRKYRQKIRLEAQREFSVAAIEDDFESLDWLNVFLEKLWPNVEPFVSEQVCEQGNAVLADLPLPSFVKQVWIHTFTVGTKPPRVDKVRTLSRTGDDVTVMDWWVSFVPNVRADLTDKQLRNRANQTFVLKAKLFGLTIPFRLTDASFQAKIRVRLRMMPNFPHIQTVNVSLMEAPKFDAVTVPIGGSSVFSPEVFAIPGLYMFLNEMVKKFAGPMLFSPLSFQVNLEQLLAGNGMRGALGILELNIKSAKDLRGADTFNNTIDPYFTFGFGSQVLGKTKVVPDTVNPVFNQRVNVMLKTSTEPLAIVLYDENESDGRKDKFMGAVLYDLEDIMAKGRIDDVTLPVLRNNRPAGQISFGLKLMRSLQGSRLPDGSYLPPPDLNTGVLNLKLLGARGYSEDDKKPGSVYAEVFVNREKKLTSGSVKKSKEASWNMPYEEIVTDRANTSVRVLLRDPTKKVDPKDNKSNLIGSATIKLTDIIDASFVGNEWFSMNRGTGEVKLSCEWNSVHMTGVAGAIGYTEPIGVVRVFISKAHDLLNLKKIGKVDPYVRLMVNGVQRGRTLAMDATLDPVYNESIYIPVSSPNQRIKIEAMSTERTSRDRTLGSFQVRLDKFIDYDDKGEPIETVGDSETDSLLHKNGIHGSIEYSLAFFSCKSVHTPMEAKERSDRISEIKETIKVKEAEREKEEKDVGSKEKKKTAKFSKKVKKAKEHLVEDSEQIAELQDELEEIEDEKASEKLTVDQLKDHNAGVLVFSILEGQFLSDGYLQVFFDMQGYATLSSNKVGPHNSRVALTGDVMIKELKEFSTVTFQLARKKDANIKSDAICKMTIPTLKFVEQSYDKVTVMQIGEGSPCKVKIRTRFIPVSMSSLPDLDSIGNSGTLHLKILRAEGLPSADSNGKSDPFAKLYLNGEEFFKTKNKKKTLNPEWNEETEISVDNRVSSVVRIKVIDWDFGVEADDSLCEYTFPLSGIDPFAKDWQSFQFALSDENNKPSGQIYLEGLFKPAYHTVLNPEKKLPNVGNMAVDGAGKLISTGVGGAGKVLSTGVGGAGKVLGTAGKVGGKVFGTASGIFRKKK